MSLDAISGATNRKETKEHGYKSEVRALREELNNLRRQVSYMMPGVLFSDPANKRGTSAVTAWRVEAFTYAVRGLIESKAAAETAFTATTHDVAASKEAWFVLTIASGGALTITKATDQTIGTKLLPQAPDNQVVVGYLGIVTNAGGIWDASTDDLADTVANVDSVTFVDAPFVRAVNA